MVLSQGNSTSKRHQDSYRKGPLLLSSLYTDTSSLNTNVLKSWHLHVGPKEPKHLDHRKYHRYSCFSYFYPLVPGPHLYLSGICLGFRCYHAGSICLVVGCFYALYFSPIYFKGQNKILAQTLRELLMKMKTKVFISLTKTCLNSTPEK